MIKKISAFFILMIAATALHAQTAMVKKGMVIKKSIQFKRAVYHLDGIDGLNRSLIVIEGNNIVVDFNQVSLIGSTSQLPDAFRGVAVMIKKGKNITIKNLSARGFKIALLARDVEGLTIDNCDFSYNYRQHLNSTQEKEDLSDWMSYHHNEKDEWLRYGAAMYLRNCNKAVVSNCKVTGGQNALMMMECNNGFIYNNDFSFNSGIGLGMYRSSNNRVFYNRINFNVRGYSHGVYNRGQDSAGILVYEQSSSNIFFKNSVTHGGDGFFLWAGQTTMDSGAGGCNDNQLVENDFSFAPTNGVEITFSRNKVLRNRIFECDNGIWGGYSFQTSIIGNKFAGNNVAIAIEHGQHNQISDNIFSKDREAIRLWSRKEQPADWGYAKYRDTRSADYLITTNSFNNNKTVFNFIRTDSLRLFNNAYHNDQQVFKIDSTVTNIDSTEALDLSDTSSENYEMKNAIDPFRGNGKMAGRKMIMMTEWGPYDFRYPLLWNTNPADSSSQMEFDVLGPKGKYRVLSFKGVEMIDKRSDSTGSKIIARKLPGIRTDIEIVAEYRGESFTDMFGRKMPAGTPYRFTYRKFFQPIDFTVKFYAFDSSTNPIKMNYRQWLQTQRPFRIDTVKKLDYAWWGGIKSGDKQYAQFLTIAAGVAETEAGNYELGVSWDDAVRIYVDDKLVVDEWNPSKYVFDESPHKKIAVRLTKGSHRFRVEHVELGGFATLGLQLQKRLIVD